VVRPLKEAGDIADTAVAISRLIESRVQRIVREFERKQERELTVREKDELTREATKLVFASLRREFA